MTTVRGQVAVVTGGASGIGRALAEALAAEDCAVVLADVERPALEATAGELAAAGARVLAVPCDVARLEDVEALAEVTRERFSEPGLVFLNAGVSPSGALLETSARTWRWLLGVNVLGVVHGLSAFGPGLVARGEGHVVVTSSATGLVPTPGLGAYSVTKHALVALAEVLREELTGTGVGVSVVCPGTVRTKVYESERNRPADLAGPSHPDAELLVRYREAVEAAALEPADLAATVLEAVRDDRFFVLPTDDVRELAAGRRRSAPRAIRRPGAGPGAVNQSRTEGSRATSARHMAGKRPTKLRVLKNPP
ncbi:MAG TPA: SDR family NAD(P)-dependent oxidoreductase [Acidimicrobiales bacterium]|nr:SDR family NAD(P)-dependent oxidoreductase [Acidimicrobiales bacterium]